MKTKFSYVIFFIFAITCLVILVELSSIIQYHSSLSSGKFGVPKQSATYSYASEEPEIFLNSQLSATHNKLKNVTSDLLKNFIFILLALCFLNPIINDKMMKVCNNNISLVRQDFRGLKKYEINFIALLVFSYLLTLLFISLIRAKEIDFSRLITYLSIFTLAHFLLLPLIIFSLFMIITKFGKKIIIACYLAYAIKILPELLMEDKVDNKKMVLMKIDEFPEEIQSILKQYDLEERVYKERKPGEDMNAALIGYGSKKRMEVYGDINSYSKDQLYSILLHEIGHVAEHSLFRKSVVYFLVLFIEMMIILLIHDKLAYKYRDNIVSFFTAFVVLVFIYRITLRQWLVSANKIVSQMSEINSDMFTKKYHYNASLAKTLYDIGVDAEDYLMPTRFYNALRSTHPSIYSRVEYLT